MRARSASRRRAHVVTLGCAKNTFDSEVLMRQLEANDFDVTHDTPIEAAPVVIINTCGFNLKKWWNSFININVKLYSTQTIRNPLFFLLSGCFHSIFL